jgi:hypothetical protein
MVPVPMTAKARRTDRDHVPIERCDGWLHLASGLLLPGLGRCGHKVTTSVR